MLEVNSIKLWSSYCLRGIVLGSMDIGMDTLQVLNCMDLIITVIRTGFINVFFCGLGGAVLSAAS